MFLGGNMPYDDIVLETEDKMEKAEEHYISELRQVRVGRATPQLVENIEVEYYGTSLPIKQIASISCPDPRLIMIKPFDTSAASSIEKAILKAGTGLNPQNDGRILHVPVPPLSEETRKKIVSIIKDITEKAKVIIRGIRRDANNQADNEEKKKIISEDEKFRIKDEIQKLTEKYEKKISELAEKKEKEITEI